MRVDFDNNISSAWTDAFPFTPLMTISLSTMEMSSTNQRPPVQDRKSEVSNIPTFKNTLGFRQPEYGGDFELHRLYPPSLDPGILIYSKDSQEAVFRAG